ncbi:aminotransferase class V-fold PLP-dependent enzyme [Microbacterium indicum]|uniref:aminotransferase class V-fold PLP-dependent enzyme n=1 Tax=Microbacterium indicum TaxID=358100 RepID=UPI00146C0A95|nr:aminotransferase class V-fold PLP-dependent enzyme [Microbacterium indicum]
MVSRDALRAVAPAVDVAAERKRTRGAGVSHHLNAAGSALPTSTVVDTVVEHLKLEERVGGYEAAARVTDRLERVYASAATLVGGDAGEISLFDSASSGLRAYLDALVPERVARVLAGASTYVSHAMHLMRVAERHGIVVEVLPTDGQGRVDLEELDRRLGDDVPTLVTVSHVPTSSGLIEPVAQIGRICGRHGALYLLDATQSVGHLAVDVRGIGCDALATTGRKFVRAPRGTAFGWMRGDLLTTLRSGSPDVRGAEWHGAREWTSAPNGRRYETWENAVAARLGLGVALDEAVARGPLAVERHLLARAGAVRAALADTGGVRIVDPDDHASAIVTFTVEGHEPLAVVGRLREAGVRVVQVPASHGQWDIGARGIPSVVRASLHVYNDEADERALTDAVEQLGSPGRPA